MKGLCHCSQDAKPGLRSHGYITGIKPYGIFVSFYGGMKGLAHTAELPLAPNQTPKDAYKVGQVVKCRVLSTDFSHQRLKLSLIGKKSSAEEGPGGGGEGAGSGDSLGGLQPGDIVEGCVREIESAEVWRWPLRHMQTSAITHIVWCAITSAHTAPDICGLCVETQLYRDHV